MEAVVYQCPNCGAPLEFNSETQRWDCKFCLSSFEKEQLEQMTDEQLASMTQDDITAKIGEITMQAIDETQAIDMPLVLTFTKNDNEWTPDADVFGSLLNLFE